MLNVYVPTIYTSRLNILEFVRLNLLQFSQLGIFTANNNGWQHRPNPNYSLNTLTRYEFSYEYRIATGADCHFM